LITQLIGVVSVAVYVAVVITILFKIMKATVGLRVSPEEEEAGLDFEEHGLPSAYADFMPMPEHFAAAAEQAVEVATEPTAPIPPVTPEGKPISCITIVTNNQRFEALKVALETIGITGMTVTRVLGYGLQKGNVEMYRGSVVASKLLPQLRIDIVVSKIPARTIINVAKKILYTGKYGDGKIFISPISNVVKIRTGEEGFDALQDAPI
jgi:Amt family ammonium transporter